MYKKIGDYGIVGNLHSLALIGRDGSVDWLCWPTPASSSIFGALLDTDDGGCFSITPDGEWDSVLTYMEDSNVLTGRFRTRTGSYTLTDFMPIPPESGGRELEDLEHVLIRLIQVQRGTVLVRVRFEPRFDYGRTLPRLSYRTGQGITAVGNGECVALSTTGELEIRENSAEALWELHEGERVALHLRYGATEPETVAKEDVERSLVETTHFWRDWLYQSGPGFFNDLGPHRDHVVRSLLVLKLLYYQPRGTMAAAATTSLPEVVGGVRNWDYRYSWVRDTSMALTALFQVGHVKEAQGYLGWLNEIILKSKSAGLQVMYRLDGSHDMKEEELPHLEGFRGSRPVRVGNDAAGQKQFSIYGHVLIAAHLLVARTRGIEPDMWHGLRLMGDFVMNHWREPDWSIWEMRTEPRHFVHSKTMCWVALHKCIQIAELTGSPGDLDQWKQACADIYRDVVARGWNEARQAFVLHYDTEALDGSTLLMSMSGFLPYDDPRMLATVEAVRIDLADEGFIYRYLVDDGLPGREGTFLPCTLWLIINLARQGEIFEAELLLSMVDEVAGPLHLLAEEYDPLWQEQLGNFPQAFSHEAYITAAMAIADAKGEQRGKQPPWEQYILPMEPEGETEGSSPESARELADILEEAVRQCPSEVGLDYAALRGSFLARRLGRLLWNMRGFDMATLEKPEDRICFWANLCNALVLHGVLALDICVSVREIPWFYRRIGCRIGADIFSAEVVLDGILRGNRPAPGRLTPPLPPGDPRLAASIRPCDPRLLFTVSTGTLSSPPITVLRPVTLDIDLQQAAEKFIQVRATLDLERKSLVLPRIFKWYEDFGKTSRDKAVFVARFTEKEVSRRIREHPESFSLTYLDYDWRVRRRE